MSHPTKWYILSKVPLDGPYFGRFWDTMPNVDLAFFVAVALLAAAWTLHRRLSRNTKGLPLPPGPKPYPVIGNLFDVPRVAAWKGFSNWSDTYGESSYERLLVVPASFMLLQAT